MNPGTLEGLKRGHWNNDALEMRKEEETATLVTNYSCLVKARVGDIKYPCCNCYGFGDVQRIF